MRKKIMEYEVYDYVISLGDSCQVAHQLNRLGLRYASYPFDWLFTWESGTITKAINNDFEGWLMQENLEELEPGTEHLAILDKEYGAIHQHIFPLGKPVEKSYGDVKKIVDRRIERLLSLKGKKILFVRANIGRKDPSLDNVILLEQALLSKFGNNIHLMVLCHSREFEILKTYTELKYTSIYEIYNEGEGKRAFWTGYNPHWDLLFQKIKLSEEVMDLSDNEIFLDFYDCEVSFEGKFFRWSKGKSTVDFRKFAGGDGKISITSPVPTRLFVLNAAEELLDVVEVQDKAEYIFDITYETRFLTLKPEITWSPKERYEIEDERMLGVRIEEIRIYRNIKEKTV